MLLTTCSNCAAQFKVQPEQLSIRQGRVMCGRCRHVFNAFESLKRVSQDYAAPDADASIQTIAEHSIHTDDTAANIDATREHGVEENHDQTESAVAPAVGFIRFKNQRRDAFAPPPGAQPDKHLQNPNSDSLNESEPNHSDHATVVLPDETLEHTDFNPPWLRPKVVRPPRSKLWFFGCLIMLIVLAAQLGYFFRTAVVEIVPQTRPYFVTACDALGCKVSWGRDNNMIKIMESDLIEPPGKPGRILVTAILANRHTVKQDLPALELRLTDTANQVLVSRVLQPADYLGRALRRDEGIDAGAELFINLHIESSNKAVASGYGLRAFYP